MAIIGLDLHQRASQLSSKADDGTITDRRISTSRDRFTAVLVGGRRPASCSRRAPRAMDERLRRYLSAGSFPEAQRASARDRAALLLGYVDVVVLRDVIECHAVSNPLAPRWIERQVLANPGGVFSIKKHYDALRSQRVPVGSDTLHNYLASLEDAFLVHTVHMHSSSERQRMVNPRKAYPVDTGLIALLSEAGVPIMAARWKPRCSSNSSDEG